MELTQGSETSANYNLTPGKYPKEYIQYSNHGESLKSRTIILPVVLYECETWSLTLREGHRMRVFENRVLRRIFGPKRDEVTGEWRKLHNEELNDLYFSPNIVRVINSIGMRWAGHVARRGVYNVLVRKTEMGGECSAYGVE